LSSKKEKFLESAQKFIAKGQLDRAIKDYEQVVAIDPNDIRHRQRLAELLVRANRSIEAIGEYEAIGKYYADNGFYLKAIAVYKQVQKLEPDDIKISLNLATLNEKQGLTGNALAEYGRVYSHFEKSGKLGDALKILESMVAIDPDNLATRLKFAETRYALGQKDEAYQDFRQVAMLLRMRGDDNAFSQLSDRIGYLYPAKKDFALELLAAEIDSGNASLAVARLQEITRKDESNLKAWHLLLDAYQAAGYVAEAGTALEKLVRTFPDDPRARERQMQSAVAGGDVEAGLVLLDRNFDFFKARAELHLLERICQELLALSPRDARLIRMLMKLYEAQGDLVKLAETVERLNSLTGGEARPVQVEPADHPADAGESVAFDEAMTESLDEGGEIPLSLSGDDYAGPLVGDGPSGGIEAGSGSVEADIGLEVDLELEISDDELADLESLYGEDATEDGAGRAAPDEMPVAGGEFVELTVDGFPDLEAAPPPPDSIVAEPAVPGPKGIFSGVKKGLDQQLDQGDTETRYNLGIAFKEMGLFDEAMTEFEAAAADPKRRIDCLTLQGICCRDKGDLARAEAIFRGGIALEGLTDEELLSITYELALLLEGAGRMEDALAEYRKISARRSGFRETEERIARLEGGEDLDELELVDLETEDPV
jgi:tetratricopeptide (TPR) repeat protein